MPEKIIILDTGKSNILPLKNLFRLLGSKDCQLYFYSKNKETKKYCTENNFTYLNATLPIKTNAWLFQIFFIIFLLPFFLYSLIISLIFKIKHKPDALICLGWQDKILFTPWAKLFGQKVIWIELPGPKKFRLNFLIRWLIGLLHKQAKTIVFNQKTANKLSAEKYGVENIQLITPGINLGQSLRQENIFHDLAARNNSDKKNNFYTIGTIVDLNKDQEIEIILGAIKKALNVIPNIQFIIIGEGQERKNLTWLAKKMEIGNLTWFVGEQAHLHKWLNSFNIFITAAKDATFSNLESLLSAQSAGIPAIAPQNHGFDDLIQDGKNGLLIDASDSDLLVNAIIKINQDKNLAERLSKNAKESIKEKFTDEIMAESFIKLL